MLRKTVSLITLFMLVMIITTARSSECLAELIGTIKIGYGGGYEAQFPTLGEFSLSLSHDTTPNAPTLTAEFALPTNGLIETWTSQDQSFAAFSTLLTNGINEPLPLSHENPSRRHSHRHAH